jgi:hypothetical protein
MTKAVPKKVSNRTEEQIVSDLKLKDLQKRQQGFIEGVNQLQETFQVRIGVELNNTPQGNFPQLKLVDIKGQGKPAEIEEVEVTDVDDEDTEA